LILDALFDQLNYEFFKLNKYKCFMADLFLFYIDIFKSKTSLFQ